MPRINRVIRAKAPKLSGLWPPPATAAMCRAAVERATVKQLIAARETLTHPPAKGESDMARTDLQFEIVKELKTRFRKALAVGLSQVEIEKWSALLEDRKYIRWHVSRKKAGEAAEKHKQSLPKHKLIHWRKKNAKN